MKKLDYVKFDDFEAFYMTTNGNKKHFRINMMLTPRFYVLDDDRAITENIDYDQTVNGTYYVFKGKPKTRTVGHSLGRRVVYYLYPEKLSC